MGLIITSIILTIITFIAAGLAIEEIKTTDVFGRDKTEDSLVWKLNKKMLMSPIWMVLILFGCFTNVGANTVGIVYNPFKGGVQSKTLTEGYKTKNPLTKVYKISTKVNEMTFSNLNVQSKDSQWLNTELQVQARIDKAQAFDYFKKYGDKKLTDISSVISNTIKKELESVTIKYNITDILGEKRNDIVNETLKLVQNELIKDGIQVERLVLIDTDAGSAIENAIANEAVAKKQVDTAEYNKQKAELEGDAKVIAAQKEKEANELINKTLTDEIIVQQFIEKWDGKLPTTYAGEDIMTMFNLK